MYTNIELCKIHEAPVVQVVHRVGPHVLFDSVPLTSRTLNPETETLRSHIFTSIHPIQVNQFTNRETYHQQKYFRKSSSNSINFLEAGNECKLRQAFVQSLIATRCKWPELKSFQIE